MTAIAFHAAAALLAATGLAGAAAAESVVIHDAVARVQVIPEARGDVSVTVTRDAGPCPRCGSIGRGTAPL